MLLHAHHTFSFLLFLFRDNQAKQVTAQKRSTAYGNYNSTERRNRYNSPYSTFRGCENKEGLYTMNPERRTRTYGPN